MGQLEARNQSRHKSSSMKIFYISLLLSLVASQSPDLQEPPAGQRCSGRNYQDRRCCTPEQPCGLGEGDCDGPLDGGPNDGHDGCQGDLVCGSNNCMKFGAYYHPKDDCCDIPSSLEIEVEQIKILPNVPFEPPTGQRCRGRNYDGKRCCTPENPCDEGEGDCDGPGDGGQHDGHAGCKGDLVCGSNNCLKFGAYYHAKDDCCEAPAAAPLKKSPEFDRQEVQGWGPWSAWGPCSHTCGAGRKSRKRQCIGNCKNHHLFENQERICINPKCNFL